MITHEHMQTASIVTYSASTASIVLWGLQLSDWGVIVSALAAVCGVAIQAYVAIVRTRTLKADRRHNDSSEQ